MKKIASLIVSHSDAIKIFKKLKTKKMSGPYSFHYEYVELTDLTGLDKSEFLRADGELKTITDAYEGWTFVPGMCVLRIFRETTDVMKRQRFIDSFYAQFASIGLRNPDAFELDLIKDELHPDKAVEKIFKYRATNFKRTTNGD